MTLTLASVAAVLLPATASAATVARDGAGALVYTAAAGATNDVSVQQDGAGAITFYTSSGDAMTTIAAGCAQSDIWPGDVVTCTPGTAVRVDLGDGDDRGSIADAVSVPVTVAGGAGSDLIEDGPRANTLDGGTGDDKLNGGEGDDVLLGGDGNDDLQGKNGRDRLDGGAGDDLLHPDGYEHANADVVDGGPGLDSIEDDYSSRFTDVDPLVAITLGGGADDGRPGEGDSLVNVERVALHIGGTFVGSEGADEFKLMQVGSASTLEGRGGDDRLRGGDGADRLDGGAGADSLDAGFGDDVIVGGPGRDTISADLAGGDCGPMWCKYPYGNDTVEARDGEVDSITCGAGADTVNADAADVVAPDCETVVRGGSPARPGRRRRRPVPGDRRQARAERAPAPGQGAARGLTRPRRRTPRRASSRSSPALGKTVVARGSTMVEGRQAATVKLKFTSKGRAKLRRARSAKLTISGAGAPLKITLK